MKKVLCLIALLLMLTSCSMNRDNIPSLLEIQENGGDWATEKLSGYTADDLEAVWLMPHGR